MEGKDMAVDITSVVNTVLVTLENGEAQKRDGGVSERTAKGALLLPEEIKTEVNGEDAPDVFPELMEDFTLEPGNGFTPLINATYHVVEGDGKNRKRFVCNVCEASFAHKSSLVSHIRKHTGERPYRCSICNSAFRNASTLSRHVMTHTGERPFKCDFCGHEFAQRGGLNAHRRTHTGEKPFKCSVCGIAFTWKSNLLQHMRTHTGERPYKCTECVSAFAEAGNLTAHMRTHTGERPFKCKFCGACFRQGGGLKTHLKLHNREKRFHCDKCPLKFPTHREYKRHMRSHEWDNKFTDLDINREFLESGKNPKEISRSDVSRTIEYAEPYKLPSSTSVLSSILKKNNSENHHDFSHSVSILGRSNVSRTIEYAQPYKLPSSTSVLSSILNKPPQQPVVLTSLLSKPPIQPVQPVSLAVTSGGSKTNSPAKSSPAKSSPVKAFETSPEVPVKIEDDDDDYDEDEDDEDDDYDDEEDEDEDEEAIRMAPQVWSVGQTGTLMLAPENEADMLPSTVSLRTQPQEPREPGMTESTGTAVLPGDVEKLSTNIVIKQEPRETAMVQSTVGKSALISALTRPSYAALPVNLSDIKVEDIKTEIKEEPMDGIESGVSTTVMQMSSLPVVKIKDEPYDPYFS